MAGFVVHVECSVPVVGGGVEVVEGGAEEVGGAIGERDLLEKLLGLFPMAIDHRGDGGFVGLELFGGEGNGGYLLLDLAGDEGKDIDRGGDACGAEVGDAAAITFFVGKRFAGGDGGRFVDKDGDAEGFGEILETGGQIDDGSEDADFDLFLRADASGDGVAVADADADLVAVEWVLGVESRFAKRFLDGEGSTAGVDGGIFERGGPTPEAEGGVALEVCDDAFELEDAARHDAERFADLFEE